MSIAAALGTVALVGGVLSGNKNAKLAANATDKQTAIQREALEFTQQQYEDWKNIYGPIEQNLSEFYTNLTPDYIESQGLQAQQKSHQQQIEQLNQYFSANNIDSGVQADMATKIALESARQKSQIRADAPLKAAEAKSSFLSLGIGQKQSTTNAVTNQMGNLANTYGIQAANATNAASAGYAAAGSGLTSIINSLESANEGSSTIE